MFNSYPKSKEMYEATSAQKEVVSVSNKAIVHQFWKTHYPHLVRRVRPLCGGSRENAEDLVSRATLRLIQFVDAHDHPLREVDALFWRVVRNLAIDEHRNARRSALIYDHSVDLGAEPDTYRLPPAADDSHAQLVASQDLAAVQRQVEQLPEEARALFTHRFIDERPYCEIAQHFEISEALARKRVQKLRARLAAATTVEADGPQSQRPASHVYLHKAG